MGPSKISPVPLATQALCFRAGDLSRVPGDLRGLKLSLGRGGCVGAPISVAEVRCHTGAWLSCSLPGMWRPLWDWVR